MKTKKIFIIAALAACTTVFSSCYKNDDDKASSGAKSCWKMTAHVTVGGQTFTTEAGYYWGTVEDIEKYINGTLSQLGQGSYYTYEKSADGNCNH